MIASAKDSDLERFLAAQQNTFHLVRQELSVGHKRSHWMWFIFPQLRGLGVSETSHHFSISDLSEARAYLAHGVLGVRLIECTALVLTFNNRTPQEIFGGTDALKFLSSMTLFEAANGASVFAKAIDTFYDSRRDSRTVALLKGSTRSGSGPDAMPPTTYLQISRG